MNPGLIHTITPELEGQERVLWVGRPDPVRMSLQSSLIVLFAIPWTVSAIQFWLRWPERDLGSMLFNGSFVVVGVVMLLSPVWTYFQALSTVYAITDRRVLIVTGMRGRTVHSYGRDAVNEISRMEKPDGRGDLTFAKVAVKGGDSTDRMREVKFVGIPEVREVERLLRNTFRTGDELSAR